MKNGRARVEEYGRQLKITVPVKKNFVVIVFGLTWLAGWLFGLVMVGGQLTSSTMPEEATHFMTAWLVFWIVGGLAISTLVLWNIFGKESLRLEGGYLFLEKTLFGIGRHRNLSASEVSNFRYTAGEDTTFGNRMALWGLGPGKVRFDYGLRTYSFASGVDEAEARYLAEMLTQKIGSL